MRDECLFGATTPATLKKQNTVPIKSNQYPQYSAPDEVLVYGDTSHKYDFESLRKPLARNLLRLVVNRIANRKLDEDTEKVTDGMYHFTTVFSQHTPILLVLCFEQESKESLIKCVKHAHELFYYSKIWRYTRSYGSPKRHLNVIVISNQTDLKTELKELFGSRIFVVPDMTQIDMQIMQTLGLNIKSAAKSSTAGNSSSSPKEEDHETKVILAYGDSNTWGMSDDPSNDRRYMMPWPWQLETLLNKGTDKTSPYRVADHALCSRTTDIDSLDEYWINTKEGHVLNGYKHFAAALETEPELDWVIILLGTNDLRSINSKNKNEAKTTSDILNNVCKFVTDIITDTKRSNTNVLVISPPLLDSNRDAARLKFTDKSKDISRAFAYQYMTKLLDQYPEHVTRIHFVSLADGVEQRIPNIDTNINIHMQNNESVDGVHITEKHSLCIAEHIASVIQNPYKYKLSTILTSMMKTGSKRRASQSFSTKPSLKKAQTSGSITPRS